MPWKLYGEYGASMLESSKQEGQDHKFYGISEVSIVKLVCEWVFNGLSKGHELTLVSVEF